MSLENGRAAVGRAVLVDRLAPAVVIDTSIIELQDGATIIRTRDVVSRKWIEVLVEEGGETSVWNHSDAFATAEEATAWLSSLNE